ncbi:MAG: hypothetical protein PVI23_04930 [Maricaulaceae bacterium]|jgi:hypothetical protein
MIARGLFALTFLLAGCASSPGLDLEQGGLSGVEQTVRLDGRELRYAAFTGRIGVGGEGDGPHGQVFFTAYLAAPSGAGPRPVSFVWNGGPGANSALLHFEAFGPRTLGDEGLEDNPWTLLPYSDLVFVDPVGTGFSSDAPPEHEAEFYSTLGDHAATAEFIEHWLDRFNAGTAPVYLIGESFGTWRASAVAELLAERGRNVDGVVLISGGATVGLGVLSRDETAALRTPGQTAAAFHHDRLAGDFSTLESALDAAETWARETYLPALARLDALTQSQRDGLRDELAGFVGLDAEEIDIETVIVRPRPYLAALLADRDATLDTFDMRRLEGAPDASGVESSAEVIDAYFRDMLGYRSETSYFAPTEGGSINARWNYDSGEITPEVMAAAQAGEGPPGAQPWALNVIALDPEFRVFVAAGFYDSLNSCAANREIERRLAPDVADNFTMACYAGGHMMYRDAPEHERLTEDIAAFIAGEAPDDS